MSVKVKLLAGFLAIAGLVALAGIMGIMNVGTMGEQTTVILQDRVPQLKMGKELDFEQKAMRVNLLELTLVRQNLDNFQHYKENYEEKLAETNKRIDALLYGSEELGVQAARKGGEIERLTTTVKEELVHFTQVADELIAYKEGLLKDVNAGTITMQAALADDGLTNLSRDQLQAESKHLEEASAAIVVRAEEQMDLIEEEAAGVQASSTMILLVVLGVGVGVAIAVGFFLAQSISKPVLKVVKVAQAIAKGDLSSEDVKIKSKDEIGELAVSINKMARGLREAREKVEEYNRTLEKRVMERSSQLRDTQAELVHKQKLSTIGELAASVGHDIAGPIMTILYYTDIVKNQVGKGRESYQLLEKIVEQANHMRRIVRNLLALVREGKDSEEYTQREITGLTDKALSLVEFQLEAEGIKIKREYAKDLPKLRVKPGQMQEVFLNLINNARHSLNSKYENGKENKILRISVRCARDGKKKYVEVKFHDTGVGIPQRNLKKIFNPFFTSEKKEERTGLGLSISQRIIKNHRGDIRVESKEGEYATFTMELIAN